MSRPARGTAATWRNRIVGYEQVSVEAIQANPKNHRLHPEAQRRALSGVLDEVGIVQNVIINRTTGRLVDGHLRVALAVRAGEDTLPATIVELSEEEERKILLSLDYLAGDSSADTVWEVARDNARQLYHPTQKPAALAIRALENSSRPGDTVLDLFLGGAGTLVGAEATGRRCRGVDIEPKYIAVALERWATMTGGTPKQEPAP